jgi:hypothetical protein
VPIANAYSTNVVNGEPIAFDRFFPFRLVYNSTSRGYTIFDGTGVNGTGNIAETLEFRAIDRNLQTPFYHQWNLGWQWELAPSTALEIRYNGSRGRNLLLATALNEPWDLNDPNTPQVVLDRITTAFRAGGGTASEQDPNALVWLQRRSNRARRDDSDRSAHALLRIQRRRGAVSPVGRPVDVSRTRDDTLEAVFERPPVPRRLYLLGREGSHVRRSGQHGGRRASGHAELRILGGERFT